MSGERTGAELLVACLERYGVERAFGNPGTTELPVLRALAESGVDYHLADHEDVAVGAAAGYATVRRDHLLARDDGGPTAYPPEEPAEDWPVLPLGVVNLHLLAGVAHGLGNLYDAWVARAPLLVTAGVHAQGFAHEEPILAGDLERHVEPHTKWAATVRDADALPAMVRRAVRTALTPPTGPVFLGLPTDVARERTDAPLERLGPVATAGRGDPAALDRAAAALADADDVALVVGDGVARAGPDAVAAAADLAEAAGARVHGEALSAAVALPQDHEQWGSVLPPSADELRRRLDADAVALAGCATNTTLVAHDEPLVPADTTVVHLGADAGRLGRRHPADAAVHGDLAAVLPELAERLRERLGAEERRRRRAAAADRARSAREAARERHPTSSTSNDARPTAGDLATALGRTVPDALVVDEGVGAKYALLAHRDLGPGDFHSTKGGCLGYGLPAAVGAALAERERAAESAGESGIGTTGDSRTGTAHDSRISTTGDPRTVVAFVGDGAFSYYPNALRTAVRAGVDLTVVVANDGGYGSVAAKAASVLGSEADPAELPGLAFEEPVDAAAVARGHGADGSRVERLGELEDALDPAARADGVRVVDVRLAE